MRLPSTLGDWEVLETPGHAPSHVCLLQRERGVAIVGDLVARAFAPYFDYGYTPDPIGELLASYDRVESIGGIRLGLPGHGRPLEDLSGTIAAHRHGIHQRLDDARAAVAAGPAGAYEMRRRMYGEPTSDQTAVWQTTEVLCYLKHLRDAGDVVRDQNATGAYSYRLAGAPRGADRAPALLGRRSTAAPTRTCRRGGRRSRSRRCCTPSAATSTRRPSRSCATRSGT